METDLEDEELKKMNPNMKVIMLVIGVILILVGIFAHTTIEREIHQAQITEIEPGIFVGPTGQFARTVSAIITGILIGVGLFMLWIAIFKTKLMTTTILSIIVGILSTIYFYFLTPY